MKLRVTVTANCTSRSGKSAKGNDYTMAEAYAHLPGCDFPQKFSYYCTKQNEVLPTGDYECDVTGEVKDGRVQFNFDPRQSRRISTVQTAPAQQQVPAKAAGSN